MEKNLLRIMCSIGLAACCLAALPACDTTVKTDTAEVGDAVVKKHTGLPAETYAVDTAKSQINWIGAKMTGRHNGYFKIRNGELHMNNKELMGGEIVIDMTTMRSDDKTIDAAGNEKLTKHLQSADFFDAEKYSTAKFELTSIALLDNTAAPAPAAAKTADDQLRIPDPTHRVTGNLTIKGQTKSVSFPARITLEDNQLKAKANFNIDRTKWGLVYRSDKSLGDQTIYPEVNIGFDIVAKAPAN